MMKKMFALLLAASVVSFTSASEEVVTEVVAPEDVTAVVVPTEMPSEEVATDVVAPTEAEVAPTEAAE
jgi:hypothetical protein